MRHHHSAAATVPRQAESDSQVHHHDHERPQPHGHAPHQAHSAERHPTPSLDRTALMATLHCLSGCTIGELLGMAIGTALGWGNWSTIALAIALAFFFGYAMTVYPLRRAGMAWGTALGLALASDTLSMTTMELADNAIMMVIPGAMDAGIFDLLFWGSLGFSLIVAGIAAFPVNRWLIARGKGHALVHGHHCH
ncbi:MAG: DUF4396 domain-containing protein [Nitrospira sp.]|nr:DUF4396 domain-containing protein [Nitrospira sp.]MBX3340996.1 DUF4396 domain-containing protein [Nitrospira sp.]MBX3370927.1 DUF4396 domain-containing protein [Nitrospira sp.]HNA86677.1 DUF4396 domain-containing protein [Nitrospira sp.]